jgi:hypothetical protein
MTWLMMQWIREAPSSLQNESSKQSQDAEQIRGHIRSKNSRRIRV